jgi:hypothetical protein
MEFAITAEIRIWQWMGMRLMTPGGHKPSGVFLFPADTDEVGRKGAIA